MAIASANTDIAEVFYGTVPIVQVYEGTNLIYDKTAGTVTTPAFVRAVASAAVPYSATTKAISKPNGSIEGDILVLFMHCDYGATTGFKPPSGFMTLNTREIGTNGDKQLVAYKVAGPTEPAAYTMTVPVDADLRADMIAVGDADTTKAPTIASATSASSATTHTAPSVTPGTDHGLMLSTISKSASTGGSTFSWIPPTGMTERTDRVTNGYVTMTTATQEWTVSQATGTRTFTLATSSAATQALAASVVVPSGVTTGPVVTGYQATPTDGSGGPKGNATGLQFIDTFGTTSNYHRYAGHLTGDGPHPLVVHLHGDGAYEYENPNTWTSPLYMDIARSINGVGVIPLTPDVTSGYQRWWEGYAPTEWLVQLIQKMYRDYNIDRRRVFISGFSGGAVVTTTNLVADWPYLFDGGGAMMLGGGGAYTTAYAPTATVQRDFLMRWHVGGSDEGINDDGTPAGDGYDALAAATAGEAKYRADGWDTQLIIIPGEDHLQSENDGPPALQALVNESNTHYGI